MRAPLINGIRGGQEIYPIMTSRRLGTNQAYAAITSSANIEGCKKLLLCDNR